MSDNDPQPLQQLAEAMKRDWDDRAREDSRWYINTIKRNQDDDEFDATGLPEVENFILAEPLITRGRDLKRVRLLEIGCGIGRMTRHLAGIFGEVHGTDVSAEMIAQARERFRDVGNAFFHETNGLDFAAMPDAHFDVIFSVYVFQHVPSADVVRSNIRDACRVLAPGGVFKFQVCGINHTDYDRMPKDTWTGTPFSESEIRLAARANGVRCLSIYGLGTQYCWAVFQKPAIQSEAGKDAHAPSVRIEAFGRTGAIDIKAIPTNGDHASLSLLVSGLDREVEDANSVVIEINGQDFLPHYVGSVRAAADDDRLAEVSLFTSPRMTRGLVTTRVKNSHGKASTAVMIELLTPQTILPQIHMVNNAVDGGVDIYARGDKSVFRIFSTGMDERANVETVCVLLNEDRLTPESVTLLPANGFYLSIVRLPENVIPGEAEVRIQFNDLVSPPAKIRVLLQQRG
ncbi:MAG: class I SAM-dependent methyltransferase [Blastocatellia bacterium]